MKRSYLAQTIEPFSKKKKKLKVKVTKSPTLEINDYYVISGNKEAQYAYGVEFIRLFSEPRAKYNPHFWQEVFTKQALFEECSNYFGE